MTSLIFHGGVSTIGGNCVIVEGGNTRIMFDNDMCFSSEDAYYKDFLSPRTNNVLRFTEVSQPNMGIITMNYYEYTF